MQVVNMSLTISVSILFAWSGFLALSTHFGREPTWLHRIFAGGAFLEAAVILFLQSIRPPFSQTIALITLGLYLLLSDMLKTREHKTWRVRTW